MDQRDLAVWAKCGTGRDGWHPLVCHTLDVAAVAEALWADVLTPPVRARLATGLSLAEGEARAWVPFCAGLHDLGKASPAFQIGTLPDKDGTHRRLLAETGFTFSALGRNVPRHGEIGARVLRDALKAVGLGRPATAHLATLLGGHHGVFPAPGGHDATVAAAPENRGGAEWAEYRTSVVSRIASVLGVPLGSTPTPAGSVGAEVLAGLTTVADWIGSDTTYFPYLVSVDGAPTVEVDLTAYLEIARERAARALRSLGWTGGWRPGHAPVPFRSVFGREPRPLQRVVEDLAPSLTGPALLVIEAPTGEGKTEAALYAADVLANATGYRGTYFALPTQATSNQMLERFASALRTRYPDAAVELQLLHGQKTLNQEFRSLIAAGRRGQEEPACSPAFPADADHAGDAGVRASEWFLGAKHALLAPYGVGTVDQALLAALAVKHQFVRTFALAGRCVVIDEVHSYDAYMGGLLERLLEWIGALGSSAILLSATLPRSRKDALMDAFARGAAFPPGAPAADAPSPGVTVRHAAGTLTAPVDIEPSRRRSVALRAVADPVTDAAVLEEIIARVRAGACVAVVCNTVRRAQLLYERARAHLAPPTVSCFHSRFPIEQRASIEERVVSSFGKGGPRPHGALLVATQVIEQSLDLDFDLMVTDFAPAELLVQRAGRVYRHSRDQRSGVSRPELWVVMPRVDKVTALPLFPRDTVRVYGIENAAAALRPGIALYASWVALRGLAELVVPDGVRDLVEAAYADAPPEHVTSAERDHWYALRAASAAHVESLVSTAAGRRIPAPTRTAQPDLCAFTSTGREDDDVLAGTRLGSGGHLVVPLGGTEGAPTFRGAPIDLSGRLTQAVVRALHRAAVPVSIDSFHDLLDVPVPRSFSRSPVLLRAHPVRFEADGRSEVGAAQLHLGEETGLRISWRKASGE